MSNNQEKIDTLSHAIQALRESLSQVIRGKSQVIDFLLVALSSGGNVLLEDVPGVGKTTLVKALAKATHSVYCRIQFTPDLLPADVLGGSIYNPKNGSFSFRPGPIFANIVLADEINRASPRTQSALLEVMTENQATIEGVPHPLPTPFMIIATQNPIEFHGTYPLPESQLDRFMLRLALGYPGEEDELRILHEQKIQHPLHAMKEVTDSITINLIQEHIKTIEVEESVARYITSIVRASREHRSLRLGGSPRSTLMLYRASQALAFIHHRNYVIPDDIRTLAIPVLSHRILLDTQLEYSDLEHQSIIEEIVNNTQVPM